MIKVGDTVRVVRGRDKGKEGKVTQAFPAENKVVVDGVNSLTKHIKARRGGQDTKGQKVTYFGPIRVENVRLVVNGVIGRIGVRKDGDKKVRVVRKNKAVHDVA